MRARLNDIPKYQRQITEYENKIALISSEIERLKMISDDYRNLKAEYDRLRDENMGLRAELDRMDRSWNDKHQS